MGLPPAVELLVSLVLLAAGAEVLVRGAVTIARRAGLSSFFVGLTIVGIGTSSPELAATLRAALDGRDAIGVGNVLGSNVMNIALVLGLTALIRPIPVKLAQVRGEIWIAILCALVPFVALLTDGRIDRVTGGVLVAGFVVFLVRGYLRGRSEAGQDEALRELLDDPPVPAPKARLPLAIGLGMIVVGLGVLVWSSGLLVDSASTIARDFGVSELVIGVTVVAFGTSAPELVTSLVAAFRGESDVAVGNVLGSNIANVLLILGTTSIVRAQEVPDDALRIDTPVLLVVSLALLPLVRTGSRLSRLEGALLLIGYSVYVAFRVWPSGS